ncbi:MAG: Glucose-responsive transcription factor [Geoglossum simile]|nr:MAG: Glucose-responsive transcription factor [Geoglossum simile]
MQSSQGSYPSPSVIGIGDGTAPFFTSQQRLSSPDNLPQLSAQMLRHAPSVTAAPMTPGQDMVPLGLPGNDTRSPTSPQQQQQQPHAPQSGMDPSHDPSLGDLTAPRKRSKVSRACDECRRKKIRCDATSESGVEQCSSCKRTNVRCQFSRVPMKRGPSKGYIKELADRLNTLENSMVSNEMQYAGIGEDTGSPRVSDEASPPPINHTGAQGSKHPRKRTLSASDDVHSASYLQPLQQNLPQRSGNDRLPSLGSWSQQDPPRHLPHPTSSLHNPQTPQPTPSVPELSHRQSGYRPQYSPNGISAQPFWSHGQHDTGRRASVSLPFETSDTRPPTDPDQSDAILEWDERAVDEMSRYYGIIHPTFPLLPNTKARLRSRLANCPITLREAFLEALYAAVRSLPSSAASASPPDFQSTRKAVDLISASQFENVATRTMSTNLIFLQSLILMALEADNHGPATMRGQLGPPRAVWLGSAVGLSYFLKLHVFRYREKPSDGDPDSDEKLSRRIWWVLVTLDRWHASSTSSPLLIPDTSVVLLPEDHVLLGDAGYQLTRHLAEVFVSAEDAMAPNSPGAPLVGKLLNGEIDRFRESIDSTIHSLNLVRLSYWHVKLLLKRHTAASEPYDLLGPAQRLASILNSPTTPITPLNHHFAALAALTLVELADMPETKEGAWKGIQDLHEALDKRRGFLVREDGVGWDSAVRDLILKKRQQQQSGGSGPLSGNHGGLQHLADLAVGERGSTVATPSGGGAGSQGAPAERAPSSPILFDPTLLTRCGYLTVLVQDSPR